MEHIETLIIGGGQAGLSISHALSQRGRSHLILERGRFAERWHSERWDGLRFQTPNALVNLSGFPFPAGNPDAFASAAEIADFIGAYAAQTRAPVRTATAVTALRAGVAGAFVAETIARPISAANVVVATGPVQRKGPCVDAGGRSRKRAWRNGGGSICSPGLDSQPPESIC